MDEYGILNVIAQRYGLSLIQLGVTGIIVTTITAGLKGMFPALTGKAILIPVGAISFGLGILAYQPNWGAAIAAGAIITGCSIGGWAGAKQLAHKVGTESTSRPGAGQ